MYICVSVSVCVCFYNRNQDQYSMNELVVKTYFSSIAAEKEKVTTFYFPVPETQSTFSI